MPNQDQALSINDHLLRYVDRIESNFKTPAEQNWLDISPPSHEPSEDSSLRSGFRHFDEHSAFPLGRLSLLFGPLNQLSDLFLAHLLQLHCIVAEKPLATQWITAKPTQEALHLLVSFMCGESLLSSGAGLPSERLLRIFRHAVGCLSEAPLTISDPGRLDIARHFEKAIDSGSRLVLISQDALPPLVSEVGLEKLAALAREHECAIIAGFPSISENSLHSLLLSDQLRHCFQVLEMQPVHPEEIPIPRSYFTDDQCYPGKLAILYHEHTPPIAVPIRYHSSPPMIEEVPDLQDAWDSENSFLE